MNLNTATAADLEGLPGIGAKTAARIVEYRQKNGPFKKVEELMNVRGVGEKNFLKLKPQLAVGAGQGRSRTAESAVGRSGPGASRVRAAALPMTRFTEVGGYSLLELMMAMTIGVLLTGTAVPEYLTGLDDLRARGAAHHLSGRLQRARMEAVRRSAMVGVQFTADGRRALQLRRVSGRQSERRPHARHPEWDRPADRAVERLPDQFPGVEFGAIPGLPPVDAGGTAPGTDPVRLGSGSIASFSALGTATSGTVYIRGRRDSQYAVRIYRGNRARRAC